MRFLVLSRNKAKEYSYKKTDTPYIIISIIDINTKNVVFDRNVQLKDVLRLSFDDVEEECTGAISEYDAKRIVDFVYAWMNYIELIVVHCEAGTSRSAGVCGALMLWANGDDSEIFYNDLYRPNMRCYQMIKNEILSRKDFWT